MPTAVSDTTRPVFSSKCHPGTVHSRPDSGSRNKASSPAATLHPHTTPPSSGSGSGPSSTLRHSIGTPWPSTPRQSVTEAAESSSSANPGPARAPTADLWRENIPGSALLNDDSPMSRACGRYGPRLGIPLERQGPLLPQRVLSRRSHRAARPGPRKPDPGASLSDRSFRSALSLELPLPSIHATRLQDAVCTLLGQVIGLVPVYLLECRPDADAARLACETLFGGPLTPLRSGPENPDRQCR